MPSRIRVLLGRNVCRLRNLRKLTQEQLAARLGMDRRYVQRIEAGKARPAPEVIIGLPLALETSWNELMHGEPDALSDWRRMRDEDKSE